MVVVVWHVLRHDAVRLKQNHELVLALLGRLQSRNLGMLAPTEEEQVPSGEDLLPVLGAMRPAESEGLWNEIDEGRRAMVDAGLDPNNPTDVAGWNQRYGGFQV